MHAADEDCTFCDGRDAFLDDVALSQNSYPPDDTHEESGRSELG